MPNFKLSPRTDSSKVKGINSDIPYVIRISSTPPDWSPTFTKVDFEEQRFGLNDSDDCWEWSGVEDLSFQSTLFMDLKQLSPEAMNFLVSNGYFNSQGQLSLSRRFLAILSERKDDGGDSAIFWETFAEYGMIPRSMLDFTPTQADNYRPQFVEDFYNPSAITPAMIELGKQFLRYFASDYEFVGREDGITPDAPSLIASLYQSPLQCAIPIPKDVSAWNNTLVSYDGTLGCSHEVVLYKVDFTGNPEYPYFIYDQYFPNLKQLSKDYLLYRVTNAVVTPIIGSVADVPSDAIPYPSESNVFVRMWQAVHKYIFG